MKHVIIALCALCLVTGTRAQSSLGKLWDEANTAYVNADYQSAITTYDSILATGHTSYKLYYNLGNAYFKEGNIGKSILFYNKALKLAPSDSDINYNLKIANTYVKDKIEPIPQFFIKTWLQALRVMLSSNGWAIVSLVLLSLMLVSVLLYLLSQKLAFRKTGFYTSLTMLLLFIFAVVNATIERRELTHPDQAVVMSAAVPVKSSPDRASKDIFVLHEGTKVDIINSLQDWREIAIADGNKGWIRAEAIETIQ